VGLQTYRKKRQFDVTPEPRGRVGRAKGNQFVIQKHAARRLHYDLRLELDGVMKSWAVTRGPSPFRARNVSRSRWRITRSSTTSSRERSRRENTAAVPS
jgi:DNA ligase D-like protein (predicted 3'-phosphoesterase)